MRKFFRFFPIFLALISLLTACSQTPESPEIPAPDAPEAQDIQLELWVYPVGGWSNSSTLSAQISAFHRANPHILVTVKILDYNTGDQEIEDAIASGQTPDLVFEGPERLTAGWGARGLMADIGDLWKTLAAQAIYPSVASACLDENGKSYIYPVCMTTHCMAVNRDLFEAAGAWQYIDQETHTWTTDGFASAVRALRDYGVETVATVYCGGQAGDQGTRALVTNLYGGSFTDPGHTAYTFDSPENVEALSLLRSLDGIVFDPTAVGTDVINQFCRGDAAMCFCWNVATEVAQTISNPDRDFDIFPMAFPTDSGDPSLQGGIWGFGIFDKGDPERVEAAKTFIRFLTEDVNQYTQSVLSLTFWPVRDIPNIYENDDLMSEYFILRQFLGDYYQVTPGWAGARTAWWQMLQEIGSGADIPEAARATQDKANAPTP